MYKTMPPSKKSKESWSHPNDSLTSQYNQLFRGKWRFRSFSPKDLKAYQDELLERGQTMIHIYELLWLAKAGILGRPGWNANDYWSRTETTTWHQRAQESLPAVYGLEMKTKKTTPPITEAVVCKGIYNSLPGKVIHVPLNKRINRLMNISEEGLTKVIETGRIPDSFFQTQLDYVEFNKLTDQLQVDKILRA